MKKLSIAIIFLLLACLLLSACASPTSTATTTTPAGTTTSTTVSDSDWAGGIGNLDMESKSIFKFSVESAVWSLVDPEEFEAWKHSFEGWGENGTRDPYEFNMYTLITEFDIPRDKIEEICDWYTEKFGGVYFTDEQVEAIYNGTEVEVYQLFANPYAVMVGKEAYPPQWMVEHTAEDYLAAGITHDILTAEFEQLLVPCTEEQREYLRAQLQALAELDSTCSCNEGSWDMTQQYLHNFWIDTWLTETLDTEKYEAWANTFEGIGENWTRSVNEFNKYVLIKEFAIPRDKVEEVCRQYKELFNADYFTDEQVEAIYNGTEVEVYQLFANPYAVMVGKEAYPPQWMVEHTAEDYLAAGITHEILTAEFEQLLIPCTEEQRDYLRAQLQALAELEN